MVSGFVIHSPVYSCCFFFIKKHGTVIPTHYQPGKVTHSITSLNYNNHLFHLVAEDLLSTEKVLGSDPDVRK